MMDFFFQVQQLDFTKSRIFIIQIWEHSYDFLYSQISNSRSSFQNFDYLYSDGRKTKRCVNLSHQISFIFELKSKLLLTIAAFCGYIKFMNI